MIRSSGTHRLKKFPALFQSTDVGCKIHNINTADSDEFVQISSPVGSVDVDNCIPAEGGQDAPIPAGRRCAARAPFHCHDASGAARCTDGLMMFQCVGGSISGA